MVSERDLTGIVLGVVDDFTSIANAARRFFERQTKMDPRRRDPTGAVSGRRRPGGGAGDARDRSPRRRRLKRSSSRSRRSRDAKPNGASESCRRRSANRPTPRPIGSVSPLRVSASEGRGGGNALGARLLAEAEAIRARAEAPATNQEAVIGRARAERRPEVVEAAAEAFDNVDRMIVLNGARGVSEIVGEVRAQGACELAFARQLLAKTGAPVSLFARMRWALGARAASVIDRLEDPREALEAAYRSQAAAFDEARRGVADVLRAERRLEIEATALLAAIERRGASVQAAEIATQRRALEATVERPRSRLEFFRTERLAIGASLAAARARSDARRAALESP